MKERQHGLITEDGHLYFFPEIEGQYASAAPKHTHLPRIISWTLEGPLKVLMSCSRCCKTETIVPNKRLRKIPWGFNEETWPKFLERGAARA